MALTVGDNFSYQGAKPLDARLKYDTLASMKAVADATMYDGCLAYCVATDKTYQWKSTNTVDEDTGKWREFSSGSGHEIKNNGVAVTEREVINFTDFDIADDFTNEETDIKAHRLTSAEIADICTPLPGAVSDMPVLFDEREAEYVIGLYVLDNGTKKPVYQKTIVLQNQTNINGTTVDVAENVDILISREITGFRKTDVAKNPVYIPYMAPTTTDYDNYILSGYFKDLNSNNNKLIWQWQVGATQNSRIHDFYITVRYTKTTDTPV